MTAFLAVKIHYDHRPELPPYLKYSRTPTQAEYERYLSLYRNEGIGGEGFHECLNFSIPEEGKALVYFPPGYIPSKTRLDQDFLVFSFTYKNDRELGSRIVGVHGGLRFVSYDGIERRDVPTIPGAEPLFYHAEAPSSLTTLLLPPVPYDVREGVHLPALQFWGNGLRNLEADHAQRIIDDALVAAKDSLSNAQGSARLVIERELDVLATIRKRYFGDQAPLPQLRIRVSEHQTLPDQELGRLGEEYVFRKELESTAKLGFPASSVEWVSQALPQAPFDIKTIRMAEGGPRNFYLEVKSSRIDGAANVYVSSGQVQFMEENPDVSAIAIVTVDYADNVISYREFSLAQLLEQFSLIPIKYKLAGKMSGTPNTTSS